MCAVRQVNLYSFLLAGSLEGCASGSIFWEQVLYLAQLRLILGEVGEFGKYEELPMGAKEFVGGRNVRENEAERHFRTNDIRLFLRWGGELAQNWTKTKSVLNTAPWISPESF